MAPEFFPVRPHSLLKRNRKARSKQQCGGIGAQLESTTNWRLESRQNPHAGKRSLRSAAFPGCGLAQLSSSAAGAGERRILVAVSRSSLFWKASFHENYSQRFGIWGADQLEHVGTVLLDFSEVLLGIIGRMGATHRANNLQPAMSQTAQGTGMALSFVAVGPVEG